MTDDTLREDVEKLVERLSLFGIVGYRQRDESINMLLAFARAQQAKGIREALRMVDEEMAENSRRWALFRCEVKAQATARETDATKKGSSPS